MSHSLKISSIKHPDYYFIIKDVTHNYCDLEEFFFGMDKINEERPYYKEYGVIRLVDLQEKFNITSDAYDKTLDMIEKLAPRQWGSLSGFLCKVILPILCYDEYGIGIWRYPSSGYDSGEQIEEIKIEMNN